MGELIDLSSGHNLELHQGKQDLRHQAFRADPTASLSARLPGSRGNCSTSRITSGTRGEAAAVKLRRRMGAEEPRHVTR